MDSAIVYMILMFVLGFIAHKVTISVLGMKDNMFKDFRLDDSDEIV